MSSYSSVSFFAILLISFSSETSGCEHLGITSLDMSRICPKSEPSNLEKPYIDIDGRHVPYGSRHRRIELEEPSNAATYICNGKLGSFSWNSSKNVFANQLRVTYETLTFVYVEAFRCDNFEGPNRAGIHCAIEAFSKSCPGRASGNYTCVFEVKTSYFSSETVRNALDVKAEIAGKVRQASAEASAGAGVNYSQARTVVQTYSIDTRSYIVIPEGFRFCSFSEVKSKKDYLISNGFIWSCDLPTFVQTTAITGRCSDLPLCENQSPCFADTDPKPTCSGRKSAEAWSLAMLLALCTIASSNLAKCLGY